MPTPTTRKTVTELIDLAADDQTIVYVEDKNAWYELEYTSGQAIDGDIIVDGTKNGANARWERRNDPTGSGGGGASDYVSLTDTPGTFVGQAGSVGVVNAGETALAFQSFFGAGANSVSIGNSSASAGDQGVAVGNSASAAETGSVAVGYSASASSYSYTVAVGKSAASSGYYSVAMGNNSVSSGYGGVAIGHTSQATGAYTTAIGAYAYATQSSAASFGYGANAGGSNSTAIGAGSAASQTQSLALGHSANASASGAIAIGQNVANSLQDTAIIGKAQVIRSGTGGFANGSGVECILTVEVNLTTTNVGSIVTPSGVRFFPEQIDLIIESSTAVTGDPTVQFGDSSDADKYVAPTVITKTNANERTIFSSLLDVDGTTNNLQFNATVAATATALVGRACFRGILLQD